MKLVLLIEPSPANSTPRITALMYRREKKIAPARRILHVRGRADITWVERILHVSRLLIAKLKRDVTPWLVLSAVDTALRSWAHVAFIQGVDDNRSMTV